MIIRTTSPSHERLTPHHQTGPAPVLVIDDDADSAVAILADLAEAGYPGTTVTGGDAVLRLVRAELMRLVISELYIECAEGPCVIAALKNERARLPRLRVVAYSRHRAPDDDAWALAAGADSVLHKPSSARVLVREVRRLDGAPAVEPSSWTEDQGGTP